jgi:UDP-2-acetamido-2,6-beta-L-arabino-hexul-4-ose reductase
MVRDRSAEVNLVYIDDVVDAFISCLKSETTPNDSFLSVEPCYRKSLGEVVDLIESFRREPDTLEVPDQKDGFAKKLYATFLSYLPEDKFSYPLTMHCDDRGSFTEVLHTLERGQVSVNISKPGITKGQHWHHSKWEFFVVVSGKGLIQQRKIRTDEVLNFEVSGEKIQAIHMLPGYTHNIINLSETEDLVTVMWANEAFDPNKPDTFFEKVED